MSGFTAPSTATGIDWNTLKGALLVIEPNKLEEGINTSNGVRDAVRADVHVLDGPQAGTSYTDCLIFPRVLISQTRASVGQKVLGRLDQGNAKPGQNPPWKLNEATPQDQTLGAQWLSNRSFSAPTAATNATAQPPF